MNRVTTARTADTTFKVFYQNVRSITNKKYEFEAYIEDKSFDIVCLSEHWLTGEMVKEFCLPGYILGSAFCRENARGGGTAVYLFPHLEFNNVVKIDSLSVEKDIELCSVYINKFNIFLVTIYRAPSGNFDVFMTQLVRAIEGVGHRRRIMLLGDFNVLFGTNQSEAVHLMDVLETYGFNALVNVGTRSGNCLDNVLVNFSLSSPLVDVIDNSLSDHDCIHVSFSEPTESAGEVLSLACRPITQTGKLNFYNSIESCQWSFLSDINLDANAKCLTFCKKIQEILELCFPLKNYKTKSSSCLLPWFGDGLREMREHLHFLQELCRQYPSRASLNQRNSYKKQYKKSIIDAKREYNDRYILNSHNKPQSMWKIINDSRGTSQTQNITGNISPSHFNTFFINAAKNLLQCNNYSIQDVPFRTELNSYCPGADFLLHL